MLRPAAAAIAVVFCSHAIPALLKRQMSGVDICSRGYSKENLMIRRLGNLYMSKRCELRQKGVPDWWDRAVGLLFVIALIVATKHFPLFAVLLAGIPLILLYACIKGLMKRSRAATPGP
jgi:hypothetical protein